MSVHASNNPFACVPAIISGGGSDILLAVGEWTYENNILTYGLGFSWRIIPQQYSNTEVWSEFIPPASPGTGRDDIIVANIFNSFERIPGIPGVDSWIAPPVPPGKVLVQTLTVTENGVEIPEPITGSQFIKKANWTNIPSVGNNQPLAALTETDRNFIVNAYSESGEVTGFIFGLISSLGDAVYPAQEILIENKSGVNIPMSHNSEEFGVMPFWFPNLQNYTWKPNEVLTFKIRAGYVVLTSSSLGGDVNLYNYYTKSETDNLLEDKADLVDGKVPSSQLPSYVDDVLEFADLASFPITGESGKIYIALDTNLTYRWGGSTYVRVNEGVVLGETSTTAYRGDRGKTAYDHSQEIGNPHQTTLQQVVDEDGTVTDKSVVFKSATPDSTEFTINNEEVKIENVKDEKSTKIGVQEIVFTQAGKSVTIRPKTIDDDYDISFQAKNHTVAGIDDVENAVADSNFKQVNANYTLLQVDSGKTILVDGNNRVITVPNDLTGKFHITVKVRGTGATLIDADGLLVGKPTELTSPYTIPQFGVLYFLRDDDGNIDLTGDIV